MTYADEELVVLARSGDRWAAEELVRRYRDICRMRAFEAVGSRDERDDLYAILLGRLARCIDRYSVKYCTFGQYVGQSIANAIRDFGRSRRTVRAEGHRQSLSLDAPVGDDVPETWAAVEAPEPLISVAISALPEQHQRIAQIIADSGTCDAYKVAAELGIPPWTAGLAIETIRVHVRDFYGLDVTEGSSVAERRRCAKTGQGSLF